MYTIDTFSSNIKSLFIQYKLICYICVILDALNELEMTGIIDINYITNTKQKIRIELGDIYKQTQLSDDWLNKFLTKIGYHEIPKNKDLIVKYIEMERYIMNNQITPSSYNLHMKTIYESIQQLLNVL